MATNGQTPEEADRARLIAQNEYISAGLGFAIHPTIVNASRDRKETIRIASVTQGSQSFAGEMVPFSIQGLQISDVTSSIKAEFNGAFDIVAVRLLQSNMTGEEFNMAMLNLTWLLRPGGWIQWIDWDPLTVRVAGAKPGTSDQALRKLLLHHTDHLKSKGVGTTYKISGGFRAAGLEDDDSDIYPLTPDAEFTRNIAKGAYDLLREEKVMESDHLEKLWSEVETEIETGGPLLWYDLWCHIARKP